MLDQITIFLSQFVYWEWWAIIAIMLLILEVFAPTAIFVWPGLAAIVVSLSSAMFDTGWQFNWIAFAVLSVVFLVIGRKVWRRTKSQQDHFDLNMRSHQMIGRYCTVIEVVNYEKGRVRVGDTSWLARTEPSNGEILPDTPVKVVSVEGTTLIVQPESATA